jgi:hypothetical protein
MVENPLAMLDKVVKVVNYRGEAKDRRARVVAVRDTYVIPLAYNSYRRNKKLPRSRFLITVFDLYKKEFRSYYHSFVEIVAQPSYKSLWHRLFNWR